MQAFINNQNLINFHTLGYSTLGFSLTTPLTEKIVCENWTYKELLEHMLGFFRYNSQQFYNCMIYYEIYTNKYNISSPLRCKKELTELYNVRLNQLNFNVDYVTLVKNLIPTTPLLTNYSISEFTFKIMLFKLKLLGVKISCIFFYLPMFLLNKIFNITNPISYENFTYSLLYILKLKFIF